MPQMLTDLKIEEVSVVDAPSCAETDPVTGVKTPRATVALYKRDYPTLNRQQLEEHMDRVEKARRKSKQLDKDDPGTEDVSVPPGDLELALPNEVYSPTMVKEQKGKKMKLSEIMKSDAPVSRELIAEAVRAKAERIAKRDGTNVDAEELKLWERDPALIKRYEASKPAKIDNPSLRQSAPMVKITDAERELDRRARKRMRKTGDSYPKCCAAELESDPSLYQRYSQ